MAVEIEVTVVNKVMPNVLVDRGSGLNILPEHTMKKLGLGLTAPSPLSSTWQIKVRRCRWG